MKGSDARGGCTGILVENNIFSGFFHSLVLDGVYEPDMTHAFSRVDGDRASRSAYVAGVAVERAAIEQG